MAASFFFYDLETSGFNPRTARIMQFAGQRTDSKLKPLGDPVNVLIKLTPDVLPEPDAILVTGITPQQTLIEGLSEAEFLKLFYEKVVQPQTIFVGFNSLRFDDEFMRFLHYRNFYDAYEWQWKDNCSRWDILDVVRMTRALRPMGIEWPFATDGKPTNRLELLTKVNKLSHTNAHDALSDVRATIEVAKLIRGAQPDLFEYLLKIREKNKVADLVEANEPFVYTSGRYPSANLHTSAVVLLAKHPQQNAAIVYDLRYDPGPYIQMDVDQLVDMWKFNKDPEAVRLPVKTLKYNRCPAVAPLGVINDQTSQERLKLSLDTIAKHLTILRQNQPVFSKKILQAVDWMDEEREQSQTSLVDNQLTVDERLYEKFIDNDDRQTMHRVRTVSPDKLNELAANFNDDRLKSLMPLYRARNFLTSLNSDERAAWDSFCHQRLFEGGTASRLARYFGRLEELGQKKQTAHQQYLIEELQLYGQSIVPLD